MANKLYEKNVNKEIIFWFAGSGNEAEVDKENRVIPVLFCARGHSHTLLY
jgi:hypothetical protein